MTTKVVARLLNAANDLLGWTVIMAVAKGDGKLWTPGPVSIAPERSGFVTTLSLHWCDVNVEMRFPLSASVTVGQIVTLYDKAQPILTVGEMPQGLPATTVGSVRVGIPVGGVGMVGRG